MQKVVIGAKPELKRERAVEQLHCRQDGFPAELTRAELTRAELS